MREKNRLIIITGTPGTGKSTLAKLIVGSLAPQSGTMRLDGIDIFQWSRLQLGPHIGYLPQDLALFDGSIKDNIVRLKDCNDKWLIETAQLTGIYQLILDFCYRGSFSRM